MFGLYQRSNFHVTIFFLLHFLFILGRTAKKCALSSHTLYNCTLFGHWSGHSFWFLVRFIHVAVVVLWFWVWSSPLYQLSKH